MARRNRTAEILAAANLVPLEIAREQEQTRRASATSQALASLVPALIQGGVDIYGGVTKAQREDALQTKKDERADKDALADIAAQKATTDAQKARADAMKARAEADKAEAEAKRQREVGGPAKQLKAASDELAGLAASGASYDELRQFAQDDPRMGSVSDDYVAKVYDEQRRQADRTMAQSEAERRKEAADIKLAERKAAAPLGPKPKSPEEIERARKRDYKTDLDIKIAEQALRGDKPMAPSDNERKVQNDVDSLTDNIAKLEGDIGSVNASGLEPGLVAGPARAAYAKVFGDEKWTDFESTRDAVNLQIFGTLRSDAPSEEENKQAAKLKIGETDNLDSIRAKLRTIKALLDAKRRKPGSRLDELINDLRGVKAPAQSKAIEQMTEEEVDARIKEIEAKR